MAGQSRPPPSAAVASAISIWYEQEVRDPVEPAAGRSRRVALVAMPFQVLQMPSPALGILTAALRRRGHAVDDLYLNLEATRRFELELYWGIATRRGNACLFGEWLFSHPSIAPGAGRAAEVEPLLMAEREHDDWQIFADRDLDELKARADALISDWLEGRDWGRYDLVGFSVTYQQLNASLRLAAGIKARWPEVRVVLGGASLKGPMGEAVAARHPWLDAVFTGYAEQALPDYLESGATRATGATGATGVTEATEATGVTEAPAAAALVRGDPFSPRLDDTPLPVYESYFATQAAVGLTGRVSGKVPIETSRGCWWGEKNPCTFCGCNADDIAFRCKSPARVVEEVRRMRRYGRSLWAVDNIMPLSLFTDVFPELERAGLNFGEAGFFETKANLTPAQLKAMRRVGIRHIQPGIESLATPVLRAMRKGVSAVQNIWMLRAAEEHRLHVAWNILYGFPEETAEDYRAMAALLPRLVHLRPPMRPSFIRLDRFSPLFDEAEARGLVEVRPAAAARLAFGDHAELARQAPFFDFAYADGRQPRDYAESLIAAVQQWRRAHQAPLPPRCSAVPVGGGYLLVDNRGRDRVGFGPVRLSWLDRWEQRLLAQLDVPRRESSLAAGWGDGPSLAELLARLAQRQLVVHLDDRWLRLVVIRDPVYGGDDIGRRIGATVRRRLASLLPRRSDTLGGTR